MEKLKTLTIAFLTSKEIKRAGWSILNVLMGLFVSYLTYLSGNNITWAVIVLPFAVALAQMFTKYLNAKE